MENEKSENAKFINIVTGEEVKPIMPYDWDIDQGLLHHSPLPNDRKEIERTQIIIFALAVGNVVQAFFLIILLLLNVCNY